MKKVWIFLLVFPSFSACNPDGTLDFDCIADVAVTTLDAPKAVVAGDVASVYCIIKNIVQTANACGDSGDIAIDVETGYSPTFQSKFSNYEVIDRQRYGVDALSPGEEEIEPAMPLATSRRGYYAMRVCVNASNDSNEDNNARAVAIEAQ